MTRKCNDQTSLKVPPLVHNPRRRPRIPFSLPTTHNQFLPPAMPESGEQPTYRLARPFPLYKHLSWSPEAGREEAWLRRKSQSKKRRSKSVTDDDLEELKACIELGFGFDSPEINRRLYDTLPALSFYYAVKKQYNECLSGFSSPASDSAAIIGYGDSPERVKARLRQWAQVVACSVRR